MAKFEKGAEVINDESFDVAMENLKGKFLQAAGLDQSPLLDRDLRETNVLIRSPTGTQHVK